MPFEFHRLEIPEVILIKAQCIEDERGFFVEMYKQSTFSVHGIVNRFVQDNYSYSLQGVLRGLHYQKHPQAQGKLVTALKGQIYDVVVDLRRDSPTYKEWIGIQISDSDCRMLYVPSGFAHGFCVLSKEAWVVYKVTEEYAPEFERGIIWSDPAIGIRWPVAEPILSPKDAQLPLLKDADNNF